jgi:hypothetical protein
VSQGSQRGHRAVALVAALAWLVIAISTWAQAAPLGHDEAQYALAGQDALAGLPHRWFYVSRGMDAVSIPGLWLGGGERALRLLPMLCGVGFVGALWLVARRTVGPRSAAWGLAAVVGTRALARRSTDLLSDMPAAACLAAALAIIVDEIDREEGPRWRLVLVAPLLAAAFYVRYGSVVPIAVIVVASLAVGARALRKRPSPALLTAALFLVLLVPDFVWAHRETGSPLGILLASRSVPHQAHVYEGLVTYVTSNPLQYYGVAAAFAMLAGLASVHRADRRRLLVWLVATGSLVGIGLTTHAQSRYIMLSIGLYSLLGADWIVRRVEPVIWHMRRILIAACVGLVVVAWALVALRQLDSGDYRRTTMRTTLVASSIMKRDAAGRPCEVVGYNSTQLEWYSGCRHVPAVPTGELVYVVRDFSPTWVRGAQPKVSSVPGAATILFRLPELEVVRVVRH